MFNPLENEEAVDRARADGMLAGYLAVVAMALPEEDRDVTSRELAGHLRELAKAFEELGAGPSEAMWAAVSKLGDAKRLGAAIQNAQSNCPDRTPSLSAMILPILSATAVGALGMTIADNTFVKLGLASQTGGTVTLAIEMLYGLCAGAFMLRCRWSAPSKLIIAGLVNGPGLLLVAIWLNRRIPDPLFITAFSAIFGLCGVACAFAAHGLTKMVASNRRGPVRTTS